MKYLLLVLFCTATATHSMFKQVTQSFVIAKPHLMRSVSTLSSDKTTLCKAPCRELKRKMLYTHNEFSLRSAALRLDDHASFAKLEIAYLIRMAELKDALQKKCAKTHKEACSVKNED